MLIKSKNLIGLPVYTKSGRLLGEVDDIEIETDGQLVVNYQVGSKNVIKNLLGNKLIIHRDQIVSISVEKVVVEDNVVETETLLAQKEKDNKPKISEGVAASIDKN